MKGHTGNSTPGITACLVSKTVQEKLVRLGVADEFDLLLHLPLRYEDETHLYPINDVPAGATAVGVPARILKKAAVNLMGDGTA